MKYVVDTNIINWLIDGIIEPQDLPTDAEFVITHIQIDELNQTSDTDRRARLLIELIDMASMKVPTETFVLDISRPDNANLGDGILYEKVRAGLDFINHNKSNNVRDALIAEVAIKNGYVLLTADKDLADVAQKNNCQVRLYKLQSKAGK